MDLDAQEKRMGRCLWLYERKEDREYRERVHITPPPSSPAVAPDVVTVAPLLDPPVAVVAPPTLPSRKRKESPLRRHQAARSAKKIQVRSAESARMANKAEVPAATPAQNVNAAAAPTAVPNQSTNTTTARTDRPKLNICRKGAKVPAPVDARGRPLRHYSGAPARPEQLLPRPAKNEIPAKTGELEMQELLAKADVRFIEKSAVFRGKPPPEAEKSSVGSDGNGKGYSPKLRTHGWYNYGKGRRHLHEHAQITATTLQGEKGRGGEGVAYLLQTNAPAATTKPLDGSQPRRVKKYYVVKTLRNNQYPVGVDKKNMLDDSPDALENWMWSSSAEFRIFIDVAPGRSHPNICSLLAYGGMIGSHTGLLFFEYCDAGDLDQLMHGSWLRKERLPESFIWHAAAQLADAVGWLHRGWESPHITAIGHFDFQSRLRVHRDTMRRHSLSPNEEPVGEWHEYPADKLHESWTPVWHGDIKPCNVFLQWRADDPERKLYPNIKLGDFGFAQREVDIRDEACPYGTGPWGPADKLSGLPGDVWAVGSVLHALAHTGMPPNRLRTADVRHHQARRVGQQPSQPLFLLNRKVKEPLRIEYRLRGRDVYNRALQPEELLPTQKDGDDSTPARYINEDWSGWVDANRHWTEVVTGAHMGHWVSTAAHYEVHTAPACYSQCLDDTIKYILKMDPDKRPHIGQVAEKILLNALPRVELQHRPLGDWFVNRAEDHQRSLSGFQVANGKGRSMSEPFAEGTVGQI